MADRDRVDEDQKDEDLRDGEGKDMRDEQQEMILNNWILTNCKGSKQVPGSSEANRNNAFCGGGAKAEHLSNCSFQSCGLVLLLFPNLCSYFH